ncbi:ABC-three component system middle component 5, partial [Azotobacter armeniacus]
ELAGQNPGAGSCLFPACVGALCHLDWVFDCRVNKSDAFEVITKGLPSTKFSGPNGLKFRSGLMEYIYDR